MLRIAFQHDRKRILLCRRLLSTARSPYQVLGVASSATKADVKKAYIEKAKKCHPDLFPDDEEKTKEFQELQEAYSILSDTRKRAEYAQMQRAAAGPGPNMGPRHPFTDYGGSYGGSYSRGSFRGGGGAGDPRKDPLHEMLQEMLRNQQRGQQYNSDYTKQARMKGGRMDQIILRLVLAYMVLWIFFGNLRFAAAGARRPDDPDNPAQEQTSPLDQFMAARMRDNREVIMMDPREREYLNRQREVRELMEQYNKDENKKKKKRDDTLDQIENDRAE